MLQPEKPASLSMDTKGLREGLHIWVKGKPYLLGGRVGDDAISIHLSRDEAYWLMREIEEKLF